MGKKVRSILTNDMDHCILCKRRRDDIHHVFFGNKQRELSEFYGLLLPLCKKHHTGRYGPHFDKTVDSELKQYVQAKFEEHYPGTSFVDVFGRNYRREEE